MWSKTKSTVDRFTLAYDGGKNKLSSPTAAATTNTISLPFCILCICLLAATVFVWQLLINSHRHGHLRHSHHHHQGENVNNYRSTIDGRAILPVWKSVPVESLPEDITRVSPQGARNPNCSYWDCFNVYRCGHHDHLHSSDAQRVGGEEHHRIAVFVYPLKAYVDDATSTSAFQMTREYYEILQAVIESPYYTPDPDKACLFLPSIDTLNQNMFHSNLVGHALNTLPYWNNNNDNDDSGCSSGGENHLIFNFVAGTAPHFHRVLDVASGRAIIAGAGFDTWTYRRGFDISLPVYSPLQPYIHNLVATADLTVTAKNKFLLLSSQLNILPNHRVLLQTLAYDNIKDVLLLQRCQDGQHQPLANKVKPIEKQKGEEAEGEGRCTMDQQRVTYPNILLQAEFCLILRGVRLAEITLLEAMAANCIPVIVADNLILPFAEVIDWQLAAIQMPEAQLQTPHVLVERLKAITVDRRHELRHYGRFFYREYLQSIRKIVHTVLDIINSRVFPHHSRTYLEWNVPKGGVAVGGSKEQKQIKSVQNPLFLPLIASRVQGFTAIVLTYDRVDSLFTLVQKLSVVPSLQKILVIWNNQKKPPPHPTMFPRITKPLKVIQTKANKLSNRFYPYDEIETEAVLTIDDDIVMLTADELDFGYEVWREFPDRIVGYPSRMHVWDNATSRWRYESEWTNQISMVLTGAAFHHKFWNYMYTNAMPREIRDFVDEHMNCEDIAMNFLVANITAKPPIKVAPRKKFKCPECTNTEMLSADLNHMMERTECINRFTAIYGTMPLKSVEFRADPVLYKDNFPDKLKRFNDIGSL